MRESKQRRNRQIIRERQQGMTYQAISKKHHISITRVAQICQCESSRPSHRQSLPMEDRLLLEACCGDFGIFNAVKRAGIHSREDFWKSAVAGKLKEIKGLTDNRIKKLEDAMGNIIPYGSCVSKISWNRMDTNDSASVPLDTDVLFIPEGTARASEVRFQKNEEGYLIVMDHSTCIQYSGRGLWAALPRREEIKEKGFQHCRLNSQEDTP